MTIINMTPHPINIVDDNDVCIKEIPASGGLIRLESETVPAGMVGDIPLTKTEFGEPEGLPAQKDGVFYVVSQMIKNTLPERDDLLVPAEVVRDEKGRIIGCRSLGV